MLIKMDARNHSKMSSSTNDPSFTVVLWLLFKPK